MALIPLGLFVANFFSQYLSGKEIAIYLAIFVVTFFLPSPLPTIVVVVLDLILMLKFKLEHF